MRYAVHDRDGWPVAMLGFSTAAWKLAPRDDFVGWTPQLREKNLPPNLGSHILAIVRRRLPEDWTERYNTTPVLIETLRQVQLHLGNSPGRLDVQNPRVQGLVTHGSSVASLPHTPRPPAASSTRNPEDPVFLPPMARRPASSHRGRGIAARRLCYPRTVTSRFVTPSARCRNRVWTAAGSAACVSRGTIAWLRPPYSALSHQGA